MKKKILAVIIAAMAVMSGCAGEAAESTSPILDVEPVELATEVPAIEPEAEITPEPEDVPEDVPE